jgi:hypothetical protein
MACASPLEKVVACMIAEILDLKLVNVVLWMS